MQRFLQRVGLYFCHPQVGTQMTVSFDSVVASSFCINRLQLRQNINPQMVGCLCPQLVWAGSNALVDQLKSMCMRFMAFLSVL